MARTYLVFGDIDGKLDVLRVECARCQRKGRYSRQAARKPWLSAEFDRATARLGGLEGGPKHTVEPGKGNETALQSRPRTS